MKDDDEFCDDIDGLVQLGEDLWGIHWVWPMARTLGVNERTVRRWRDGEFQIPVAVLKELRAIFVARTEARAKLGQRADHLTESPNQRTVEST